MGGHYFGLNTRSTDYSFLLVICFHHQLNVSVKMKVENRQNR